METNLNFLNAEIKTQEDWQQIRSELVKCARWYYQYRRDVVAVLTAVDDKMRDASKLSVELNRKPGNAHILKSIADKIAEANQILYPVQQNLMLLMLTSPIQS